jgi:uncharacterized membrane protein YjjB (DUF3815 family)
MKTPGWKTSEFWATAIVSLAGLVIASDAFQPNGIVMRIAGLATSALGTLGYVWSRTRLKGQPTVVETPEIAVAAPAGSELSEPAKLPDVPSAP